MLSELVKQMDERREYMYINRQLAKSLEVLTAVVDLRTSSPNQQQQQPKTRKWSLKRKKKKPEGEGSPSEEKEQEKSPRKGKAKPTKKASDNQEWPCSACTFLNNPQHLSCEVCGTERTYA